jgi:hypothetical protein
MASRGDVDKRRLWAERLGRYRASGLTVARFCAREGVSVPTFYYWSSRIGRGTSLSLVSSRPGNGAAEPCRRQADGAGASAAAAVVRFHFSAGVEVLVPADCLEAIRCLAQSAAQSRAEGGGAFQEVVVTR